MTSVRLTGSLTDFSQATDEECYEGVVDRASAAERFHARGAYSADEVVDVLFDALRTGGPFYIICQDHETSLQQDQGRMQWAFDDVLFRHARVGVAGRRFRFKVAGRRFRFKVAGRRFRFKVAGRRFRFKVACSVGL